MAFIDSFRKLISVQVGTGSDFGSVLQDALARNLRTDPPKAGEDAEKIATEQANNIAASAGNTPGVFVTPASIITFPVASGFIVITWKVLQAVFPWGDAKIIPLILALLTGALFVLIDLSGSASVKSLTRNQLLVKIVVAFVNSMFLAGAALGLDTAALSGATPSGLPTPTPLP